MLSFKLRKQLLDEGLWQEKKRDSFYGSLGLWLLSVPLPIFFYGYAVDNSSAALWSAPGSNQFREYFRWTEITFYAYGASLFVSIVLFVKMFGDLLEYINYVDYVM